MTKKDRAKKEAELKKYEDPDGISVEKMNFGLWLSTNRSVIIKGVILFLIIVAVFSLLYSGYNYIHYFLYGRDADKALTQSLTENQINTQAYRDANSPQELQVGNLSTFAVQGKYDFLIPLENLNAKHFSNFSYCLQNNSGENIVCGDSFIMPSSEKSLIILGKSLKNSPSNLKFVITNLSWQRLNNHEISDWSSYAALHLNVDISDVKYVAPEGNNKTPFHSLTFVIKNNSPYHFSSIPLDIILKNNTGITGVNSFKVDNLWSSESRSVSLSWPAGGERVNKVEIIPDVNLLDSNIYLPYRGEVTP